MATTFDEVEQFLIDGKLEFDTDAENNAFGIGFGCEPDDTTYRDTEGEARVQVIVRIAEGGEFLTVYSPGAWSLADCPFVPAVCEATSRIQARMKLIRFDLDTDGQLHANIEIPLESAPLHAGQVHRAIAGILVAIRRYDAVIRHAIETGEVDLDLTRDESAEPPTDLDEMLRLAREAGGIDALEQLLGGDTPAEDA